MPENPPTTTDADANRPRKSRPTTAEALHEGFETRVDEGDGPAATCAHCGRPFPTGDAHDLHVGERHADACTPAEREAYAVAREAEDDELFYFHLRVVAALAGLYTVLVLAYMVALGSGIL